MPDGEKSGKGRVEKVLKGRITGDCFLLAVNYLFRNKKGFISLFDFIIGEL